MKRSGFTLIEVIIASALFAMVAIVGSATLAATYKVQDQVTVVRTRQETVRSVLELLSRQIKFATNITVTNNDADSSITLTEPALDPNNVNSKPTAVKYSLRKSGPDDGTLMQQKYKIEDGVTLTPDGIEQPVTDDITIINQFTVKQLSCPSSIPGTPPKQVYNSPVYVYLNVYPKDDYSQNLESSIIATPRAYANPVVSTCSSQI